MWCTPLRTERAITGKMQHPDHPSLKGACQLPNTVVSLIPTPGLANFYQRHGYKPQESHSPAMIKWVNPQKGL
jgi:hypothetical protein